MIRLRFTPRLEQPIVAVLTGIGSCVLLVWLWFAAFPFPLQPDSRADLILAPFLIGAYVVAQHFPIHIRYHTKVATGSVALFLLGVLLPAPLAVVGIVLAKSIGELASRAQRGMYPSDSITDVARWVPVAICGSLVAHASVGSLPLHSVPLVLAALVFLAGDILTSPLLLGPIIHEPARRIVVTMTRAVAPVEGALYLIGLLGALVAAQEPWALVLLLLPTTLVYLAFKSAKEMQQGTLQIMETMADTVDMRDPYTGGHSKRVAELTALTLKGLALHGPEVELIVSAARVHDIGKIGIPDAILNKTSALSAEETAIMNMHAEEGAKLLAKYPDFARGVEIIRHHHEAWDGSGYPHRLKSVEIPFGSRVIAVTDTWDAMTTDRPYRRALPPERAAAVLREGRGILWDPEVVDAFLATMEPVLSATPHLTLVHPLDQASVTA